MNTIWNLKKNEVYEKWRKYWFDTHPSDVAEYSWNYLFTGGKQIRPTLFCELQYYLSPDSEINAELAFAIECIHVASIVLDDTPWMDNADLRRGKVTLHKYFTPKKSCLIAYDLLYIATHIWKENKPSTISQEEWGVLLKSKLQRLMIGQWYDLDKKGNLIDLASLKTGVLFELVSETVAVLSNLDREFWRYWGNNLGILFQWMDDWQDREEDTMQKNRNAFNEQYDVTLKYYNYLWKKICLGIGSGWFSSDFGRFMENYFLGTDTFPKYNFDDSIYLNLGQQLFYPEHFDIPDDILQKSDTSPDIDSGKSRSYLKKQNGFQFLNGKDMIKYIWTYIDKHNTCPDYRHLWNTSETEWESSVIRS